MATSASVEPLVSHSDIGRFAGDHVNLPRDEAKIYRDQVNNLRTKLHDYITEHPDYGLVKMLLSGSLAKGLALRILNDIDVALYLKAEKLPASEAALLEQLATYLRAAYPQMAPDQIIPTDHCLRISFRGTGLDVDVAPVYAIGDAEDHGYLVNKNTGARVLTSIPRHIRFTRARKDRQPDDYAQVVRLVKWWVRERRAKDNDFRMKSFLAELIVARVAASGADYSDWTTALERVFGYIVSSQLRERIFFTDYYPASKFPSSTGKALEVFDPVNPDNNVPADYSAVDRLRLVSAAEDAVDALAEARFATTRGRAVQCWQRVLGSSFRG